MSPFSLLGALLMVVALAPQAARADGEGPAGKPFASLKLPSSLQTIENTRLSRNYEGTRCIDVKNRATRVDLGTVCESSSKAFLKDMGVLLATDDAQPPAASLDNAVVATPVAQYKLADAAGLAAKTAKVDCDPSTNAIYRPMASCQVYVGRTGPETYLYGSFFLQDHTSRKKGLSIQAMTDIWRQVQGVGR